MNDQERNELLELASESVELQRLLKKHDDYKKKIRVLRKRGILTTVEQQEVQNLKLKKLRGKDQMLRLVHSMKSAPKKKNKVIALKPPVHQKTSIRPAEHQDFSPQLSA